MNSSLSIHSGIYKGRKIPVPHAIKGNSNFTSALLKKSIFSILDSFNLQEKLSIESSLFIDLFAGSGQIGLEAISRGFKNTIFFELDKNRFRGMREFIPLIREDVILYNRDSFRYFDSFPSADSDSLVFYIDPPYTFWDKDYNKIKLLTDNIFTSFKNRNFTIIVQSPKDPKWENFESRQIGNNTLLVFTNFI